VVLPGGKHLLVSQIDAQLDPSGSMRWKPGNLAVLDLRTHAVHALYPPVRRGSTTTRSWGDAHCPGEIGDALSPHGIHLSWRPDGRMQLLVVNHGGRESVEFFEVTGRGRTLGLEWRGCVVAPAFSALNDVVALPEGGFLVTHMTRNDGPDALVRGMQAGERGANTGHVWRWASSSGYTVVRGSEGPMPNGIEVDGSATSAYINFGTSGGGVRKLDLETGTTLAFAPTPSPDNSAWSADGRLLVTGLGKDADVASCLQATFAVTCNAKFYVAVLDPSTLATQAFFEHEGPPMGMGTVAVQVGRYFYIGSAAGDRLLRVPSSKLQ